MGTGPAVRLGPVPGRIRTWLKGRRERRVAKVAASAEGMLEGREVWDRKRYGIQGGLQGSGRRTSYDDASTRDQW